MKISLNEDNPHVFYRLDCKNKRLIRIKDMVRGDVFEMNHRQFIIRGSNGYKISYVYRDTYHMGMFKRQEHAATSRFVSAKSNQIVEYIGWINFGHDPTRTPIYPED